MNQTLSPPYEAPLIGSDIRSRMGYLLIWLALGAGILVFDIFVNLGRENSLPEIRQGAGYFLFWFAWGLYAPLQYRWIYRQPRRAGTIMIMNAASLLITVPLMYFLIIFIMKYVQLTIPVETDFLEAASNRRNPYIIYFVVLSSSVGVSSVLYLIHERRVRKYGEEERQRTELLNESLQKEVVESKLLALSSQMQPHFLFNSLNSAAALIANERNSEAYTALVKISDVLRDTIKFTRTDSVTFADEINLVRNCFEIAKIRFEQRLDYSIDIDESCLESRVPPFMVQPLVENAIKHAVEATSENVRIEVKVSCGDEGVNVSVSDNGPGLGGQSSKVPSLGVGLQNLQNRLSLLDPPGSALTISENAKGGVTAHVFIARQGSAS